MAKQHKKDVFLVVQQGGASNEFYVHTFDTRKEANAYRKSAADASYNTTEPIVVPTGMEEYLTTVDDIIAALTDLL